MSEFWKFIKFHVPDISENLIVLLVEIGVDSWMSIEGIEDLNELVNELQNHISTIGQEKAAQLEINTHGKPLKDFKFLFGEKCEIFAIIKKIKSLQIKKLDADVDSFLINIKNIIQNDSSKKDFILWAATWDEDENKFIGELIRSSIRNYRSHKGNRFSKELMLIASYLYLKVGKSAYLFLSNNLVMPSISLVKSQLHEIHPKIRIGKINAIGLKKFLEERNFPLRVGFAEDATRIKATLKYDKKLKQLIGVLIPCEKATGLPNDEHLVAVTPEDILRHAKGRPKALFVQIIMAQPMVKGAPSYVLGVFPTNNEYTIKDVMNRWKFIIDELSTQNIVVDFISTDGAPTLLGAMKALTSFGTAKFNFHFKSPLNMMSTLFPCVQDGIHIANKLKTRIINDNHQLFIGNYLASVQHLQKLVIDPDLSKLNHGLTYSDVNAFDQSKDKMNFQSTMRICDDKVLDLLKGHNSYLGTYLYLKLLNSFLRAYILENEKTTDRIINSTYVVTFLRLWRRNLEIKGLTADNFISKNAWESIELNHSFLLRIVKIGKGHLLTLCSSQSCENFFRTLRSLTSSGLTEINFDFYECMMKINKVQALELLHNELRKTDYVMNQKYNLEQEIDNQPEVENEISHQGEENLSEEEIVNMMEAATNLAKYDATLCGMQSNEMLILSNHFTFPNLEQSLRNETANFMKKYHRTYEIEFEEIPLEDGPIEGALVVYKNVKLLNIPIENGCFKRLVNEDTEELENFKVSKFLYIIQEDIQKISADRLARFLTTEKNEILPEPMPDVPLRKRQSISLGNFILVSRKNDQTAFCGRIIKFINSKGISKATKKYKFSSVFFAMNPGIDFFLFPCFSILTGGKLKEEICCDKWFTESEYVCTINDKYVDEVQKELSREVCKLLHFSN
ncbi:hypothetical protein PVAND_002810 [Polypedilum vanderplanki]|uniref:Uncharacterized protein n=1 Tax=Polypedilum vanderplanki TaxID=319348 RepID=A0A9J6BSX3_POLVA|nr:hypothetical protein PVAND_002810 [Polypedilum vanderplanki]